MVLPRHGRSFRILQQKGFYFFCIFLILTIFLTLFISVYPTFLEDSNTSSPGARAFGAMFYSLGGVFLFGGIGNLKIRIKENADESSTNNTIQLGMKHQESILVMTYGYILFRFLRMRPPTLVGTGLLATTLIPMLTLILLFVLLLLLLITLLEGT
jgi:hypothetical protein